MRLPSEGYDSVARLDLFFRTVCNNLVGEFYSVAKVETNGVDQIRFLLHIISFHFIA